MEDWHTAENSAQKKYSAPSQHAQNLNCDVVRTATMASEFDQFATRLFCGFVFLQH